VFGKGERSRHEKKCEVNEYLGVEGRRKETRRPGRAFENLGETPQKLHSAAQTSVGVQDYRGGGGGENLKSTSNLDRG